jgi:DNA topoisomerase-1
VAVRLIVEREREIQKFRPQEYWTIETQFSRLDDLTISQEQAKKTFWAKLYKQNGKTLDKLAITNLKAAEKILNELTDAKYRVIAVERKQNKKNPPPPFITSSLQQTANRWLGFSAKQTMMLAQQLYESGFITYMRTDSTALADKFLNEAKSWLQNNLGEKYALSTPRHFKTKAKAAQEAHEAIRPTDVKQTPQALKDKLNHQQRKLYELIWQRAVASQMPAAAIDAVTIDIEAQKTPYQFRATGQTIHFDGYLKIYPEKTKELELPLVKKDEELEFHQLEKTQHFTKPPARYSDAGLVKKMEQYGIGRPSTYAPTIATIEARNYVQRDENKRLKPTEIAFVVIDLLLAHFADIVDYQFTAEMEAKLDNIAAGLIKWQKVIADFYMPFHDNLEKKYSEIKKADILPEEKTDEICDKCGAPMVIKTGRYGKFLACSAFPKCKNIKPLNNNNNNQLKPEEEEKIKKLKEKYKDEVCDKCGAPMVIKVGKYGPFLACSAFPKCKNIKNIAENNNSTGVKCPVCGQGEIVAKRSRRGIFYACNRYPECKTAFWARPTGEKCPNCGALLLEDKNGKIKCSNKECGYEK